MRFLTKIGFKKKHFGHGVNVMLENISMAETPGKCSSINWKTFTFERYKNYGTPKRETVLKVNAKHGSSD